MTRVLLEQNNSYASSRKKKNPLAKTHMSDAMELLDTGLEGAAAEQMEQACKLDPVSTGKRLVRVRDQLEETLRETSHASVGPGGAPGGIIARLRRSSRRFDEFCESHSHNAYPQKKKIKKKVWNMLCACMYMHIPPCCSS